MTWIKTVTVDESEEVRKAVESQRELYPIEYATPVHPTPTAKRPASLLLTVDTQRALPRLCDVWIADVARLTARQTTARDDHDGGVGHQPVSLLNRVSRRVSASGYTGQRVGRRARRRLPQGANLRAGKVMLDYVVQITRDATRISPADHERLRSVGFDDKGYFKSRSSPRGSTT
jgi:hypothetical protein